MNIFDMIIQKTRDDRQYNDIKGLLRNKKSMDTNLSNIAAKSTQALNAGNFKEHKRQKQLARTYPKYAQMGNAEGVLETARAFRLQAQEGHEDFIDWPETREWKKNYKSNQRIWKDVVLPLLKKDPKELDDIEAAQAVHASTIMDSMPGLFSKRGRIKEEDSEVPKMSNAMRKRFKQIIENQKGAQSISGNRRKRRKSRSPYQERRWGHVNDYPNINYENLNPEKMHHLASFSDSINYYGGGVRDFLLNTFGDHPDGHGYKEGAADERRKDFLSRNPGREKINKGIEINSKNSPSPRYTNLVNDAISNLPKKLSDRIKNLTIEIIDSDYDRDDTMYGKSYKLGPKEGKFSGLVPDIIHINAHTAKTEKDIRETLIHELGHYFASMGF